MPEEKKDSFTFSDKIKNSKPAGNKSFAKSSAKVGQDGKPKATLFERTRRDAPFFIAALVALLLLPFLYKYSGQASEDQVLTPGMESAEFDPERYGFDTAMVEDPDGQIAQLAGRDSLSLIKGWGSNQEEDYARDDMDLDASADYEGTADGKYAAERHSSSDMDVEENTTNIYKRRARAGTRAAFRRTEIRTLASTAWRRPGGSRLGINNWGGGLKNAAKKVGSGSNEAPKPVSLQPLRSAGPARSSFGQGAAQAARKGLDNMGKANAVEALRDAYVKPVDPTRTAGLNLFADGRTGGNGKLDHRINVGKGQTPWWWDMMKTRMQEEWMARFKRKWNWINWMDKLAQNILGGIANCLITGDSDGDVDHFFGDINIGEDSTGKKECCGYNAAKWAEKYPGGHPAFTKTGCDAVKKEIAEKEGNKGCGWVDKSSAGGARVSFFGQRLKCLGINASGYLSGETALNAAGMPCADMPNLYQVTPSGQARKWNTYIYVTARNYFPDNLKRKFPHSKKIPLTGNLLCAQADREHGGDSLDFTGKTSEGVGHGETAKQTKKLPWLVRVVAPKAVEKLAAQVMAGKHIMKQNASTAENIPSEEEAIRSRIYELDQESVQNGCVIYVQQGDTFDYEVFKNKIIDQFKEWGGKSVSEKDAVEAFYQLDLLSVESFASKNKLAYAAWGGSGHHLKEMLPMLYWRFYDAYVRHKKITHKKDGSRDNVYKAKYRVGGVDMVEGPICHFDTSLMVECNDDPAEPQAVLTFKKGYKGMTGKTVQNVLDVEREAKENLVVTAQFKSLNGNSSAEQNMHGPQDIHVEQVNEHSVLYTLDLQKLKNRQGAKFAGSDDALVGKIIWNVYRGVHTQDKAHQNKPVSTATCTFNLEGDGYSVNVLDKECSNAQQSARCCHALMWDMDHNWVESNLRGSQCEVDLNQERNQDNLVDLRDDGRAQTRLAPVLSWVPMGGAVECRMDVGNNVNPDEKVFGNCAKLPGVVKNEEEHCGSQDPIMMDSEAAAKFVQDVVAAYNRANPNASKKLSNKFYSNKYPTDGEFVDALFIAQKLGIKQVPSSAVCELGRDMVRMSKDPHAGNMSVASSSDDFKGLKRYYRNELGAFLAYVHPTSILYPNKYYGKEMSVCDWRFLPTGAECSGRASTMKMGKAYYFNYYNDSKNKASLQAYLASFEDVKIPKTYPLAELVQGHSDLAHNCPTEDCASTRNQYNKDNFFGLMISDVDSTDNQGKACVNFAGNATMSVDKALEYVQAVCKVGLNAKPYGNQYSDRPGPKGYVAGQTFTRTTTTQPGNDGSTQKQPQGQGRG